MLHKLPTFAEYLPADKLEMYQTDLALGNVLQRLGRKKSWIVAAGVIGLMIAIAIISIIKPNYKSSGLIAINLPLDVVDQQQIDIAKRISDDKFSQDQANLIKSFNAVRQMADELDIYSHPAYAPKNSTIQKKLFSLIGFSETSKESENVSSEPYLEQISKDSIVDKIRQKITVNNSPGSRLIEVSFVSNHFTLSNNVVHTLMNNFLAKRKAKIVESYKQKSNIYNLQSQNLKSKIVDVENQLVQLRQEVGLPAFNSLSFFIERTAKSREELLKVKGELISAKSKLLVARSALSPDDLRIFEEYSLRSDLISRLREIELQKERELSELTATYSSNTSIIVEAKRELTAIKDKIDEQLALLIRDLEQKVKIAEKVEEVLEERQNTFSREMKEKAVEFTRLANLERELDALKIIFKELYRASREFEVRSEVAKRDIGFEIVSPATSVPESDLLKKVLIIVASLFAAVICGTGLALILDHLDTGVRSISDVENTIEKEVIGIIPEFKSRSKNRARYFSKSKETQVSSAFRSFTKKLINKIGRSPGSVKILVTSSCEEAGKTTLVARLARELAEENLKVIAVDADFSNPNLAKHFGIEPNSGLSDYLNGNSSLNEVITNDSESKAHILPAGLSKIESLKVKQRLRFNELVEKLSNEYEIILIDSASLLETSDPAFLLQNSQLVILAVCWATTTSRELVEVLSRMKGLHEAEIKTVLTRVKLRNLRECYDA